MKKSRFLFLILIAAILWLEGFGMGRLNRWLNVFSPHKAQAAEATDSMKKGHPEEFAGLRKLALSAQATDFPEKAGKRGVYGVLMETGYPEYTVTLATFMTGDASLYFSNGGGMLGGIGHETVRKAAIALNRRADEFISSCKKVTEFPMPRPGKTVFYILTQEGIYTTEALEKDLGNNRSLLLPLFAAGQDVITEFRIIDERRQDKEKGIEYEENSWWGEPGYANCLLTLMAEGAVKSVTLDSTKRLPSLDVFAQGSDHLLSWVKSQKVFYEELNPLEVCKVILSSAGHDSVRPFKEPLYLEALLIPTADNVSKEGIPTLFKIESIGKGQSLVLQITIVSKR
ncbi:MAG: hypothetical protein WDL87_08185 [Candidatus Omnitrophota bacterium]|jgi:hypothetical protein